MQFKNKVKLPRALKNPGSFILCPLVTLFLGFSVKSQNPEQNKETAQMVLKQALKGYEKVEIKIFQETFLSHLKESIKNDGFLKKKNQKFRLELSGSPSSLIVFDGQILWYQADVREKVIFQFEEHPQILLLSGLFSEKNFFEIFEIKNFKKTKNLYVFHLIPKQEVPELKEIFIKLTHFISEIRIIWKNLNNWQKLRLSKPYYRDFPNETFQMNKENFQILSPPLKKAI